MNPKPTDYLSVQKALQILLAFLPHNQEMGTMEVSKLLGLHKSTVSRLLNILCSYDFIQQDPKTRKYMLGVSAARIGTAIRRTLREHLVSISQPYIDDLRNAVGETIALEVWTGKDTVLAYRAEALSQRRTYLLRVGDRVDVHVSAGARSILAFLPPQIVESVLQDVEFRQYTAGTITEPKALMSQFTDIRRQGYAHSSSERHYDSEIIAVPVFNHEKRPVAAVSLFTTAERLTVLIQPPALDRVKQTAAGISSRLLYSEGEY
jgi:IclR family KDG regulon transcriptional repressor